MEIRKVSLSKDDIDQADPQELSCFLLVGKFADELAMLHKLFFWALREDPGEPFMDTVEATQGLLIGQLLAAKLCAGRELLQKAYYSGPAREIAPLLSTEATDALKEINRYFNDENSISIIRNQFAFHYDVDPVGSGYEQLSDGPDFTLVVGEDTLNSLNLLCEAAVNMALFKRISPDAPGEAYKVLIDDTTKVARWFRAFMNGYMPIALERLVGKRLENLDFEVIELNDVPNSENVHIPYFTDTSTLKRADQ